MGRIDRTGRIRIDSNWIPPLDRGFPARRASDPRDAAPVGISDIITPNVVGVK